MRSAPIASGTAVLGYRLFEIDRIISRTIGWAMVSGILVAAFAATVVGLQALLAGFTQGQTLGVAASTLVAFALFQPLRRRVQAAVDRRFDRARYDAQRTVDAFAQRLRDETNMEKVTSRRSRRLGPASVTRWISARSGAISSRRSTRRSSRGSPASGCATRPGRPNERANAPGIRRLAG